MIHLEKIDARNVWEICALQVAEYRRRTFPPTATASSRPTPPPAPSTTMKSWLC